MIYDYGMMGNEIHIKIGGGHGSALLRCVFKFVIKKIPTAKKAQLYFVCLKQKTKKIHKLALAQYKDAINNLQIWVLLKSGHPIPSVTGSMPHQYLNNHSF